MSGGQTGADQAGLRAAKQAGLKTGGYIVKGFRTEMGCCPWLGPEFGLVEIDSDDYVERTELNVLVADGTVIFGTRSIGSNKTEGLCQLHERPLLWIRDVAEPNKCQLFRLWIVRNQIRTLNVAGNRESRNPRIGESVETFMARVFRKCKG